jgi:4-aminobutyrate aminotransferase-like enzyme
MEAIISQKLEAHFGLSVEQITRLIGYESNNFKIDTPDGSFVCKLHRLDELDALSAETHLLLYLQEHFTYKSPAPIPIDANSWFISIEIEQKKYLMRLLSFVEGKLYAENEASQELWTSLGTFTASLHKVLRGFRSYEIEARQLFWDLSKAQLNEPKIKYIRDPEQRSQVLFFMNHFKQEILPYIHEFPSQIIQNDGNDWNLITEHQDVTGIIDFGDTCFAPKIFDVAISLTYMLLDVASPIDAGEVFLKAYTQDEKLNEREVDLLYYLIGLRLSTSVINSSHGKIISPNNHYLVVSERPAWALLEEWISINPIEVQNRFRKAAGLDIQSIPSTTELLEQREKIFPQSMSLAYSPSPISMSGALYQYMFDNEGGRYLDFYNNIPHLGHQRPEVLEAIRKQLFLLNTNSRYLHPLMNEYGSRLLAKLPKHLNRLFLVNDGSAASDLAVRVARHHTQRNAVCVVEHGYHGHTSLGIDISNYKHGGKGGNGAPQDIHVLPLPDMYRHPELLEEQTKFAVELIERVKPACFISESIVGCGGQVPLPKSYVHAIHAAVRKHGGLCISDEVQTGFGRTGKNFWAFENLDLSPEMVIMGKSMGNGHPIAGLALSKPLAESFNNGMEFFSSYGANPVACAAGLAVLDVLLESDLQSNSAILGAYLKDQLETMAMDFDQLGEVRGEGLFLGVDIIQDSKSKIEDPSFASKIKHQLKKHGILVGTDGPKDSVLKIKPPLCITQENVDEFLDVLQKILRQ